MMLRIEAGLPLVDVEWHNSRLAFTDHERVTPTELGMGWMLRGVADDDRAFVGGQAIRRELATKSSRWATRRRRRRLGELGPLHRDAGLLPPKDEHPLPYESMLYDGPRRRRLQVGYATSFMYSPVLQRHIGLARVRPDLAAPGYRGAPGARPAPLQHDRARPHRELPLFNPARKTARWSRRAARPVSKPQRRMIA